ncbi:hypothetical protein Bca52824_032343 [Brassica carinata]|uniref:non-specific serine/threonine protein kinase n=1 Tax=Brassica carinata TaxID=52824 RepID=A0A8X7V673_BRACI|nr:hypothetical protein Bca52824_032343 [Brassica carinata]
MSDSDGSPTSSPPAPPADSASPPESSSESSAPPPTDSTSPPADSSQPPPSSDSEPSPPPPPPPDSVLPSLPWILTPLTDTPPPDSNSPPEESNNPQPPPTSTESPSPPADSETPPAPQTTHLHLQTFILLLHHHLLQRTTRKHHHGFSYGQDPSKVYSGPGGGSMCNSQQQHSSMGNSYGSQTGHQMQSNSIPESAILGTNQTHFSYQELADITQGFARHNVLGEGGFGCVYKGTLHDGKVVAVKQLKAGSGQGDREFTAEVEIISRVHHRHLVSLVGYCISDQHRLLIYEYVANQTLEHHLHGKGMPVLEWSKRVRIAIGSAKGLAYLHEDCHPKIIHRDIKSANILLDDEYEAQVADFGLARLNDTTQTHVSTRVMGTFGYLAPEYASSGKLTDRSDVFSFGVVLLELVTGRKPVDQNQPLGEESLVEWARPLLLRAIETGDYSELIDRRLEKHYVEHEVVRMIETAAACVRHSGPKRPRMAQVVRALDCDEDSGNISNGIKVGQSTTYDSGQYNQEIMKFRKMAFGIDDSTESGMNSGGYSGKSSSDFSGNESETRPFNNRQF